MSFRGLIGCFAIIAGCAAPGETVMDGPNAVSATNLKATVEKLVSFGTRNSLSTRGIGEAAAWLKGEFEKIPGLTVAYYEFTDERLKRDGALVPQRNVIATLRGRSRPDEIVVFGAHYDSLNRAEKDPDVVAPGANDNATGTAGVLEAARILSGSVHDRTIVFACFAAEEQGLIGSLHYARSLKEAGARVVAMLNNDIIGGAKDDEGEPLNDKYLRCFSTPPADSESRRLARLAEFVIERKFPGFDVLVLDAVDRPRRAGDHKSFNAMGFAAIRFIENIETDEVHHTAGDVIERIHFPYCARVVEADIVLVANLASAPPTPTGLEMDATGSLRWKPVAGATRYLVATRGATPRFESFLETALPEAKAKLQGTQPASVCVAAVDARGNLSLFSPELPLR